MQKICSFSSYVFNFLFRNITLLIMAREGHRRAGGRDPGQLSRDTEESCRLACPAEAIRMDYYVPSLSKCLSSQKSKNQGRLN